MHTPAPRRRHGRSAPTDAVACLRGSKTLGGRSDRDGCPVWTSAAVVAGLPFQPQLQQRPWRRTCPRSAAVARERAVVVVSARRRLARCRRGRRRRDESSGERAGEDIRTVVGLVGVGHGEQRPEAGGGGDQALVPAEEEDRGGYEVEHRGYLPLAIEMLATPRRDGQPCAGGQGGRLVGQRPQV